MAITREDLSEFEYDCILEAQRRLMKDPLYMELFNRKLKANDRHHDIMERKEDVDFDDLLEVAGLLFEQAHVMHQLGFWDGEMFERVKTERRAKD